MAKLQEHQATLELWFAHLQQGEPDAILTEQAVKLMAQQGGNRLYRLFDDLFVENDEAQVDAWLQASLVDSTSPASDYPTWNLSFLPPVDDWVQQAKTALEQGALWIYDQVGALCFGFARLIEPTPTPAWVTKSPTADQPSFRYELHQSADLPWEVEVTGFPDGAETVRIEVAILKPDDPTANLANVNITLQIGHLTLQAETDSGGVAEFTPVPVAAISEIWVRIAVV